MTEVERVQGPIIVGSGLAGLSVAAHLAPEPCVVVTAGTVGQRTSTRLAQGGLAAAVGGDDSTELHVADTLAAGAGLCEEQVVRRIIGAGPATVEWLEAVGARFDRDAAGGLKLGLEGAHSRRRVLHAAGDGSGAELLRAVEQHVRECPSVSILEQSHVRRVIVVEGRAVGVLVERAGQALVLLGSGVVLATGGIGGLYSHTSNPLTSCGQGLALAARAGATLQDLEMVQFHPTVLDVATSPQPLISEAVRGEGARIITTAGEVVAPLAARDVVSRAVWRALHDGRGAWLDARHIPRFADRFPSVAAACGDAGFDPATDLLPIRPAAHYHMGGIRAGVEGRTDVPGLWAVGECASTGLHGANRLASNSLLEAAACAPWVAQSLMEAAPPSAIRDSAGALEWPDAPIDVAVPRGLRRLMSEAVGVNRDGDGLGSARGQLRTHLGSDAALTAWLITTSASARRESRGAHARIDHPGPARGVGHTTIRLCDEEASWNIPSLEDVA